MGLTDFEFIIVFLITYQFLSHLSGITIKLQSVTLDIVDAYQKINEAKHYYEEIRKKYFCSISCRISTSREDGK